MCVDCETWQYLDMFRVNLKNNATRVWCELYASVQFTRVCNDDNYFFSDFRNVYKLVRGEFEYVQTFSRHHEFRSDDALDEALYFIERVSLCYE